MRARRQRVIVGATPRRSARAPAARPPGRRTGTGNLVAVEVVDGPEHCTPPAGGSAVTIGAYDGVHLGHRHLLSELRRQADARRLASVVVTFDRHPATVVRPRVRTGDPHRPRAEARAPGLGRHRPHAGGALRRGPGQRDGRGVRARSPRRCARRPRGGGGGGLPLRSPSGRQRGAAHGDGRTTRIRRARPAPGGGRLPGGGVVDAHPRAAHVRRRRHRRRTARPPAPGPGGGGAR